MSQGFIKEVLKTAMWLSPGTRRFLAQDSSTATVGFRCYNSIRNSRKRNVTTNYCAGKQCLKPQYLKFRIIIVYIHHNINFNLFIR